MNFINLERIVWLFVVAVLVVLLGLEKCNSSKIHPDVGIVSVVTKVTRDTIKGNDSIAYVPQPYAIHDTVEVDSFIYPDNEYVAKATQTLKEKQVDMTYYKDTLRFDSLGYAVVKDTALGLLIGRSFTYNIYRPTVSTFTTTQQRRRLKMYVGIEYLYPSNYVGIAPLLQFKNDNFLKLSVGLIGNKKQYGISYFPKIKLR